MLNTENTKMTWYHPKYYADLRRQARLQAQAIQETVPYNDIEEAHANPHPQPSQVDYRHRRQANPGPTVHEPGPGEPGSGSQNQGKGNK